MGFKWQTLTKVFHNKLPCFVNSYKVAQNYMHIPKYTMTELFKRFPILLTSGRSAGRKRPPPFLNGSGLFVAEIS